MVCPHSNHYSPYYSPRKKDVSKKLKSNAATFIPTYNNLPDEFVEAVEFTFDAISEFISSDVPIYVRVGYEPLGPGVLAQAGPGGFVSDFPGAAYYNTFYPIALAEKLAGTALNRDGAFDLTIEINSDESRWNTTPNNEAIGNRFDVASVLMHEVIHGLGFTAGSSYSDNGAGQLASLVFSRFIENGDRINVLDGFIQNTQGLGRELTGGNLFFDNQDIDSTARYELYAPATYQPGSSIAHLDRATFQGTADRMMISSIDRGNTNYNPGISENILHAMGWNITSIVHDPILFSEDVNDDYLVTARVNTEIGFDTSSFVFHYSTDSFNSEDIVVPLEYNSDNDEFSFLLPAIGEEIEYQYYFELIESNGDKRLVPARASEMFFTYNLGLDTTAPEIIDHTPVEVINETDIEFTLTVKELDDHFTGVDTSSLMAVISLNGVLDTLPFEVVTAEFGEVLFETTYERPEAFLLTDELSYKIILLDKSVNRNEGAIPRSGFFMILINDVPEPVVTYVNDFDTETSDFRGNGFSIRSETRFDNPAIHSQHPYRNAGTDSSLDFIYELNQLILIDEENPVIKFDEVVIVEPGERGTTCSGADCPDEFWDYVIVEGKRLGEADWQPLLNAYDSRGNANFITAYEGGQLGSKELFSPREIGLTDSGAFEVGDQIFIRFRLFSDPFAVGWGWAIDNLEIQPVGTSTIDEEFIDQFVLFPNPIGNNQILNLNINFKEKFEGELSLINASGQQLIVTKVNSQNVLKAKWDLSSLTAGLYFAQLKNNKGVSVRKLIVN